MRFPITMENGSVKDEFLPQGRSNIIFIDISTSDENSNDTLVRGQYGLNNIKSGINLNVKGKHKLEHAPISCISEKKAKVDDQSNFVNLSSPPLTNVYTNNGEQYVDLFNYGDNEKLPIIRNNSKYYEVVLKMFPEIKKDYLIDLCNHFSDLNEIISTILDNDGGYPKQNKVSSESYKIDYDSSQTCVPDQLDAKLEFLTTIFPDADQSFLETISKESELKMKKLVDEALETNCYPKRTVPVTQVEEKEDLEDICLYTTSFNIETFLKICPDPFSYFLDSNRRCQFSDHSFEFLKRKFRNHCNKEIIRIYRKENCNLARTYKELEKKPPTRCTKRPMSLVRMPKEIILPFLQEACFIENEADIKTYLDSKTEEKRLKLELAKKKGELIECGCCYGESLFEDCATCTDGDLFCKSCITKSTEVRIGDGLTSFPCLLDCGAYFSLNLLQNLLDANIFSRLLKRVQLEEVRAADIEGLEVCPFCEFATIPPAADNIFHCLNAECLKESCRKCHKVSHIPQRCEEVEDNDQAKARKYIEDEMTKALVRECWKCKKKFIKVEGCNKMTCTCGAMMCYICREPIKNYTHFNGPGGTKVSKCPLYSTDKLLHEEAVKAVAVQALATVTTANPDLKLKHDPTTLLPKVTTGSKLPAGVQENVAVVLQRLQAPQTQEHYPQQLIELNVRHQPQQRYGRARDRIDPYPMARPMNHYNGAGYVIQNPPAYHPPFIFHGLQPPPQNPPNRLWHHLNPVNFFGHEFQAQNYNPQNQPFYGPNPPDLQNNLEAQNHNLLNQGFHDPLLNIDWQDVDDLMEILQREANPQN